MQNALLVGLSRQMSLSHQIDIIANNIANIDTTGFKADTAAFSEYLGSGASDGDFTRSIFSPPITTSSSARPASSARATAVER